VVRRLNGQDNPNASDNPSMAGVDTLRHAGCRRVARGRVHIKAVADLLGHSSISVMGDTYGRTSDDTARAAVEDLSGALGCDTR